jgi:hypothetical protein
MALQVAVPSARDLVELRWNPLSRKYALPVASKKGIKEGFFINKLVFRTNFRTNNHFLN